MKNEKEIKQEITMEAKVLTNADLVHLKKFNNKTLQ